MRRFVHGWPNDRRFSILGLFRSLANGWPDTRRVWILRIVFTVVLLALAIGLGYVHINGTYKPIMNCRYVFRNQVNQLGEWVCVGTRHGEGDYVPTELKAVVNAPRTIVTELHKAKITIPGVKTPGWFPFGAGNVTLLKSTEIPLLEWVPLPDEVTWPDFIGLARLVDPPLEWLRGLTVWTILAFFLIASLVVTIVVKIVGPPIIRLVTLDPGEWKKLLGTLRTWAVILALFLLLFLIGVWRGGGLALPPF